jgi:ubiquinone/menaquinone biosynthesis C-methylase UbiE
VTFRQRFARLATDAVVRVPALWRLFRGPLQRNFDQLAPTWETRVTERYLAPLNAALAALEHAPRRVLDVGTGSGAAARLAAGRWPEAEIAGVDLSPGMIAEARTRGGPARYDVADASDLPFADGSFDLVTLVNMIPFFDELARVVAPGGALAIAFSRGPQTPIWVPLERVEAELRRRGFPDVASFAAGDGVALLAYKADRP